MKKSNSKLIILSSIAFLMLIASCKKTSDKPSIAANKESVDSLLTGAYSILVGYYHGQSGPNYGSGITNWSFGGIGADDAYIGSLPNAQSADLPLIEDHTGINADNVFLASKWQTCYAGIARANSVMQEVPLVKDGSEAGSVGQNAIAEARFLRGVYHFELAKIWRHVPYVNENATYQGGNYDVPNQTAGTLTPIWDSIQADFAFAMSVLPTTQPQAGRANYYAAEAFLAKAYLYDHQYAKALPLLTDCISNGVTADGIKYGLDIYQNNFNPATKNGQESVFAAQIIANDGAGGQNDADPGDVLNYPGSTFTGCCGVNVPSYTLVNAFKVDANGLPEFETDAATGLPYYNDVNLPNDHGIPASAPFTPTNEAIDARLDWTVGRRGIPYLDWGICGGESWTSGNLTPYTSKKDASFRAANQGATSYSLIRVASLYLWRAECEVELGSLSFAEADVNVIRARAANPVNWVYQSNGTPAANYKVGLYSGQFTAKGQSYARLAVLTEEQLEFAMEGQRFFDLQRHDGLYGGGAGAGFMAGVLNAYYKADNRITNPDLSNAKFTVGRDELYPIPSAQIQKDGGKLVQNPNY
jgi:starch-binding outer membrane protein, SusD/RagB family